MCGALAAQLMGGEEQQHRQEEGRGSRQAGSRKALFTRLLGNTVKALSPKQLFFWPAAAPLARGTQPGSTKDLAAMKPWLGLPGRTADAIRTCLQPRAWQSDSDGPGIFLQLQSKMCWEFASSRQQKALSAPKIQNQSVSN